jgi:acyl carrier protein
VTQAVNSSYEAVLAKIFSYFDENLAEKPSSPVTEKSHLTRDLRLDSMQSFEMVSDLEDHFGITMPMELFQSVETVGDVAREVVKVIAQERGEA